jgi:TPR repeat protein
VNTADHEKGLTAFKKKDYETALREFKSLAKAGNAIGQNGLGRLYFDGFSVPQSYKVAFKWFALSANQGYDKAQCTLGWLYATGNGVPQNYKTAFKWYKLAADQGYDIAQKNLGNLYEIGQGVSQNYKAALKWYKLAAEQGNDDVQNYLGFMYDEGSGVTQNYKAAFKWYTLAADQGNANGQHNLALMYDNGKGVTQDYKAAAKWYKKAAEQGHADAQINLKWINNKGLADTENRIYQRIGEFVVSFQWLENKLREIGWFILDPERSIWPPTGLRNLTNEKLINEVHRLFLDALPKCELPDPDASQSHFIEGMSEIVDTLHQLRRDRNRILNSDFIELRAYSFDKERRIIAETAFFLNGAHAYLIHWYPHGGA